jgi:hypothetical protein
MIDEIIDKANKLKFPAPNTHSPTPIYKRDLAMVAFKASRRSFIDEAAFLGSTVPVPYKKKYE